MKPTKEQAQEASQALAKIRDLLRAGRISYDNAKHFAQPHIATLDAYAASKAREIGLRPRKFSFAAFMR
jgi:hypothetical protein